MFKIERNVIDADGEDGKVTVVFDTDGVEISATNPDRKINLSHNENDVLYDLLTLAHPAYKSGTHTDQ